MSEFNSAYSTFLKTYVEPPQSNKSKLTMSSQSRFVVIVAACLSSALWQLPSQGQEISRTVESGDTDGTIVVIESSASYSLTEELSGVEYSGFSRPVRFVRAETTPANIHNAGKPLVETEATTENNSQKE